MEQQIEYEQEFEELPVAPTVKVEREKGYGRIADLEDEEPADVDELRRWVVWQLYGPVLTLGRRPNWDAILHGGDEGGGMI